MLCAGALLTLAASAHAQAKQDWVAISHQVTSEVKPGYPRARPPE